MDLTARRPLQLWDIFHCCHNGKQSNDEDNDHYADGEHNTDLNKPASARENYAFTPMKFLNTQVLGVDQPTLSADSPHTQNTVPAYFSEDEDEVSEVEVAKEENSEQSSDSALDEKDASFIYDNMEDFVQEQQENEKDHDIPDMDFHLNGNNGDKIARKNTDKASQKHNPTAAAAKGEVNFYYFFLFMMTRHFFGSLLPDIKSFPKFLLTNNDNKSKDEDDIDQTSSSDQENCLTMKLRILNFEEGKCEVHPSLSEVPTIPEDDILL